MSSEPESPLQGSAESKPETEPAAPPETNAKADTPKRHKPSRLRRFFLRHLPLSVAGLVVLASLAMVGFYFWASSARFEAMVRTWLVRELEQATGGRVEIAAFHWNLLNLEADADGLVIHGTEDAGEAPYAKVDHLRVNLSVLGMWSPQVLLRNLEIVRPGFHFIVYPDGSTNQPQPRKPQKRSGSAMDTVFALKAGHVVVDQGLIAFENRAAAFDFQDRMVPLDLNAVDVSLRVGYIPAAGRPHPAPEMYRIEWGADDLNLARGKAKPMHGHVQATVDLSRTSAWLRSLDVTSKDQGTKGSAKTHSLRVTGRLVNFAHPNWDVKLAGDLDLGWIEPATGYPATPKGVARLDLIGFGSGGEFSSDGTVQVEGGSYIGTGVVATGLGMDLHVHADPRRLLITQIVARLRQGGELAGTVDLSPWLPTAPRPVVMQAAGHTARAVHHDRDFVPPAPPPLIIPVNGKVTAEFKDVALDTILDMVSEAPFMRLGLDSRVNGIATANWTNGDESNVVVDSALNLVPGRRYDAQEAPASGRIDGTYKQKDGSVDLRRLEVRMPSSSVDAHGKLGAYPLTTPTALSMDVHTTNLGEFDTVFRDLGLTRNGKSGTAALPLALAGQADFHGTWAGSMQNPVLAGNLKATQVAVEIPPVSPAPGAQPAAAAPKQVRWDSVEASGSYSAQRLAIDHGLLRRGNAEIAVEGTLEGVLEPPTPAEAAAAHSMAPELNFDADSPLHMHVRASNVGLEELLPILGQNLPLTGALGAQIELQGPLHSPEGTGWLEVNGGSFYGEPVARFRAQGTMADGVIKLASVNVNEATGTIGAAGSYDLNSKRFLLDAHGAGIDVARIQWLHKEGQEITGKLGFTVAGFGTLDDPRVELRASLGSLVVAGEPLGGMELVAHTVNRALIYDATTSLEGVQLTLHGQTALKDDYATQARLEFSRFNIGAVLKMAHVQGLSGESSLAGTVTVAGPLAHIDQLHGEARLRELEATLSGVHLKSEGGVHATLANGRVNLDPLHITGEDTDLHVQGSLALKDKQQLDMSASGAVNLKLAQTLDHDLTAGGSSTFQVEAHGPVSNPELKGRIDFQNGALSLEDIPNGLSQLHGTLEFNQNRLEVKSLTAMSGGGLLSVSGSLAYQHGLFADLSVTGKGIRIRYPVGVSSQADATLHLQGSQNNLLLSGNVLITRFTMNQDLDIGALAAQANTVPTIVPLDAPSNHIRLDVHVLSSVQLNFQNAYAKLAGDVDLRVRGTVASPSLLGRVSITEGNAMIAGTRYELQRGDISFTNPVRIEPAIDLNATARVEDYDITLGLHGPLDKLAVTYRSDPPLPEADVLALLALGRTQSQQRLYTQQQEQTGANPTTDALLGGALNAAVSSRVQKLFGAGSVKVDPNYLGTLGNSTSRIIVEEQLSRYVTLTYATNVSSTSQQLLQAEVAINRHVSVLIARDESGVFSMVIKLTRRYR
jgi:translocation and assembly module TamB